MLYGAEVAVTKRTRRGEKFVVSSVLNLLLHATSRL